MVPSTTLSNVLGIPRGRKKSAVGPSLAFGIHADFIDIQQDAEGNLAITSEMQCYNFSVRRLNGDWCAHVYPFDTRYFWKVHPAGALLFSGVHSHLMLMQHILINLPSAKTP